LGTLNSAVRKADVFLKGAKPSKHETAPLVEPEFAPALKLVQEAGGWHLEMTYDPVRNTERTRKIVTTKLLGQAMIPNAPYEQPNGKRIRINTDYFGKPRNEANPSAGPFDNPDGERGGDRADAGAGPGGISESNPEHAGLRRGAAAGGAEPS